MGNYAFKTVSPTYTVWARGKDDNQYQETLTLSHYDDEDPNTLTDALGIFRREVNMFALGRKYVDARVLYLYEGMTRLGRAEMKEDDKVLEVRMCDAATLEKWRHAEEVLAPKPGGGSMWPLAQQGFDAAFNRSTEDDDGVTLRHRRLAC